VVDCLYSGARGGMGERLEGCSMKWPFGCVQARLHVGNLLVGGIFHGKNLLFQSIIDYS
jgi:hypothetical protein